MGKCRSVGVNDLSVWFNNDWYIPNLNMILDAEEPMVYLFSALKVHLAAWKVWKILSRWVVGFFFNSYDTLVNVTFIANWGPIPEAILIP